MGKSLKSETLGRVPNEETGPDPRQRSQAGCYYAGGNMSKNGQRDKSQRRTDELLRDGAKEVGGGPAVPFVKWSDVYAYLEGLVLEIWEGPHGPVCRFRLSECENLVAISGKGADKVEHKLQPGMEVNLGLSYAGLKTIDKERVGKILHVAFEHWGETRDGNPFRSFRVLELPDDNTAESEVESALDEPSDSQAQLPF